MLWSRSLWTLTTFLVARGAFAGFCVAGRVDKILSSTLVGAQPAIDYDVEIYDNVFSDDACQMLHELAEDVHEATTFDRLDDPRTPLETALDSVLTALGDPHDHVEYWTRQEYLNMDIHADLDESQLEIEGELRFPAWGHVLYLSTSMRAPTVVWPTQQGIWQRTDGVTVVPAVAGRVLKFPGSALHAVPKPTSRWLLSPQEQQVLDEQEEECFADENEDDENEVRSVILFNTWSKEAPRGTPQSTRFAGLPEGITLDPTDEASFLKEQEARCIKEWTELYGKGMRCLQCNAKELWKSVAIEDSVHPTNQDINLFLPLMGNQRRRQRLEPYVTVKASIKQFTAAILQPKQPTKVPMFAVRDFID